jgi:UDP:flavonoid glycosyltransferase YjiC (YdhE family)
VTSGSRVDVQPYIVLALGLEKKEHQVTLIANKNLKDFVEGYGINFFPQPLRSKQNFRPLSFPFLLINHSGES